ncbi:MAG: hypothetical protein ACTS80_01265 [Candidatus Hodgkinia cicadicola]
MLGPTNKSSAIPIHTCSPEGRGITFDELYVSYKLQIQTNPKGKIGNFKIFLLLILPCPKGFNINGKCKKIGVIQ